MVRRHLLRLLSVFTPASATPASAAPTVQARHVVCVLGKAKWLSIAGPCIAEYGHGFTLDAEYSSDEADERMPRAFDIASDRVVPTMTAADKQQIAKHKSVAYFLSPPLTQASSVEMSAHALKLVALLLSKGGLAAKSESAGLAHGKEEWLSLARAVDQASVLERHKALYRAWVRRPLTSESVTYSCGMHLLGQPDMEYAGSLNAHQVVELMDRTAQDLLASRGPKLPHSECTRYPEDDIFHNPYGYVRLQADGVRAG